MASRTIIVSNIGRCWNLEGSGRQICEAEFIEKESDEKKKKRKKGKGKTLIALSSNPSHPSLPSIFEMEIECDPYMLKEKNICVPKSVIQPIKCDPKKERCDPYYYRNA